MDIISSHLHLTLDKYTVGCLVFKMQDASPRTPISLCTGIEREKWKYRETTEGVRMWYNRFVSFLVHHFFLIQSNKSSTVK